MAIIYQLLKIMILLVEMLCLPTKVSDIFDRNITIWINFIWEKFQAAWPPVIKSHQLLLLLKFANFQYLCQYSFVYLDFHKDKCKRRWYKPFSFNIEAQQVVFSFSFQDMVFKSIFYNSFTWQNWFLSSCKKMVNLAIKTDWKSLYLIQSY